MHIEHLRCFLAVLEHGSISTAAHALKVNQPALSKTIRRLEQTLGVSLFERRPRGVVPTEYAESLAHFALAMDSNYRGALRQIEALRDARAGQLSVGAGATWREAILPSAVARLCARRPAARVHIVTDQPDVLVPLLLRGEVDLVLAPVRAADAYPDDLHTESLMTGYQIVIGRAGHPLAAEPDVALDTLARARWALPHGGTLARERFDGLFLQRGIDPPEPAVEVEDTPCLLDIVQQSDMLSYLPSLRLSQRSGRLVAIRSRSATVLRETGIITRRDHLLPPLALELASELRALLPRQPEPDAHAFPQQEDSP